MPGQTEKRPSGLVTSSACYRAVVTQSLGDRLTDRHSDPELSRDHFMMVEEGKH